MKTAIDPIVDALKEAKIGIERIVYGSRAMTLKGEYRDQVVEELFKLNFRRQGPNHYTHQDGRILFVGPVIFKDKTFILQQIKNAGEAPAQQD